MKKLILASVAALTATGAYAGGYTAPVEPTPVVVAPAVPEAPAYSWDGFYAGLQYGQGTAEFDGGSDQDLGDSEAWGVHGGYTRGVGNWVLGGELDYNRTSLDDYDGDGDMFRLRGRAGYNMGQFQPYLTAGIAHLSTDADALDISETGWTYGVGVEYLVSQKVSVGLEYTRNDFSDVTSGANGDIDLDSDLVSLRASFRF
ncbi:outer membrane protein [Paracoccus fistulariae]|uniref:Porin family protein n=1 Tax=Paracoccus fistulariae TaxID=658446 RepID=A0ABY7SN95_9RHOB|nr:porin family protein [Paracoccus fistulariae]MDB6181435.1 porin family protein [Paracoccus fistulariae]WCR07476.1 porin family protein [Paracoccus fistulariae]